MAKSKNSLNWPHLVVGDIVDVVAPAGASTASELRSGLKYLRSLGLVPRVPRDILQPKVLNFSNSDDKRFQHLKKALLAKDSKAIWCLRGGYGANRLLTDLQKLKRPKNSKVVLGFSDITSVHLFLNQQWNWPSLHSPVLVRMGSVHARSTEKRELKSMLFGQRTEQEFMGLKAHNSQARSKAGKQINGSVVGGNLAVIQSAMGTPMQLKTKNKIVFLEDISEQPHRIDRMLEQFRQAGLFEHAKAVVFGTFTIANAKEVKILWSDVIPRFAASMKIPVFSGLPVGHGKRQHTLPLNSPAQLNVRGSKSELIVTVGWK